MFSYSLFCNPAQKNERSGTVYRWETNNSKPPGPILMIGQSKIGNSSQIIFIALFSGRFTALAVPFTSLSKLSIFAGEKSNFLS
jgi:hypothetical protein